MSNVTDICFVRKFGGKKAPLSADLMRTVFRVECGKLLDGKWQAIEMQQANKYYRRAKISAHKMRRLMKYLPLV